MQTKKCTRCGIEQPLDVAHFGRRMAKTEQGWRWDSWCKLCYAANTRRLNTLNPDVKRQRDKEWYEKNADAISERRRLRWTSMTLTEKERRKRDAKVHNNKLKREALEHYGGAFCKCCGETELLMLSLDHVQNDGAAHRKALTGQTRTMPTQSYVWAKQNNWPSIYQVMCFNCNWARHWNNGICPHEFARQRLTLVTSACQAA